MISAAQWTDAYLGLLDHGRRVCAVEDRHKGRWWPGYAVRALKHREAGRCPTGGRCDDCRRVAREGRPA